MQSEWRLQVFSLPFTLHWRCNISENLLFVRLWCEFIVNLWVNWNLGCLKNCFQSPARVFIVCARCFSAFFSPVRNCVTILSARKCWNFERGVFTHQYWRFAFVFFNCCFGILMSSFSFKRSIWQVNPGSHCLKTACPKEASGKAK